MIKIAEQWSLEARHAQAQGFQVISTSVGVEIDKYTEKQEMRVATNWHVVFMSDWLVDFGKPISTLTQRDYDRVPQMRLQDGAAWETIR